MRTAPVFSQGKVNNNFTAFTLPAGIAHRFTSPLHKGLTKLTLGFGSTAQSTRMRFTIDDLPNAPTVGAFPSPYWKTIKSGSLATSVAAVNTCTKPICYFFEVGWWGCMRTV